MLINNHNSSKRTLLLINPPLPLNTAEFYLQMLNSPPNVALSDIIPYRRAIIRILHFIDVFIILYMQLFH